MRLWIKNFDRVFFDLIYQRPACIRQEKTGETSWITRFSFNLTFCRRPTGLNINAAQG
jgi:hypothetical protein